MTGATSQVGLPIARELVAAGNDVLALGRYGGKGSREKIEAWYNSDEYQPLVPLREAASEMKITSYTTMS